MALGKAVIAAGVGCRKGAKGEAVLAAIDAALVRCRLSRADIGVLATAAFKADEQGIREALQTLAIPLSVFDAEALSAVSACTLTRSARSLEIAGTESVSEASALAAAGVGARLLGPRLALGPVTCALAIAEDRP